MTEWVEQSTCIKFCIELEHSSVETIQIIQKAAAMGTSDWKLHHKNTPAHGSCLFFCIVIQLQLSAFSPHPSTPHPHPRCIMSCAEFFCEISNPSGDSAPYSPDWAPCDIWLCQKLKSPLKGKRFQPMDEIQENTTGQLMVTGRTVWGPKVPILKWTEASLSYVQCFLCLVSSPINVYNFYIIWLDTF